MRLETGLETELETELDTGPVSNPMLANPTAQLQAGQPGNRATGPAGSGFPGQGPETSGYSFCARSSLWLLSAICS